MGTHPGLDNNCRLLWCKMTVCAFLVDVVIGELQLTQPSAIFQRSKDSICPIVGVKISNGPLLYIPFLAPENIKNYLKYVHQGHHSIPVEVEESYLEGGKFLFQRGKSCLYTAPNEAAGHSSITTAAAASYQNGALLHGRRTIKIIILNGLCFPPTVFGSCETVLTTVDQTKLKHMLRGKLSVCNNNGKVVAHLTISVSCRNLGEDIALHTQDLGVGRTGDLNRIEIPGAVFVSGQASDITEMPTTIQQKELKWKNNVGTSVSKNGLHKTHDIVQHTEVLTVAYSTTENNSTNLVQNSMLEQPYSFSQDVGESKGHDDPSEIIALKIAEFESNLRDESEGNQNISVVNHGTNFESKHPTPILYTGHNTEAEMLWNKKMLGMGEYVMHQVDAECHNWRGPKRKTCSEYNSIPKERIKSTQYISEKHPGSFAPADVHKRKTKRINFPSVNCSSVRMKQNRPLKPLCHPSGWLRSTPVASLQQYKNISNPKLNRTSLLRRAKLDPQLAHQLRAEIHYQVKQRLKHLDEGIEAELVKIKSKKFVKENTYGKLTVGCQTEDGRWVNIQKFNNPEKSCTHETVYSLNEDEQYKGKRKKLVCKNQQRFQGGLDICLEKDFGIRGNGRVRTSELKRNLTYDVDVTELQATSKNEFNGYNKEDFELTVDSELFGTSHTAERQKDINNHILQTNTNKNSQERSPVAELQTGSKEDFGLSADSESVSISHIAERQDNINYHIPQTNMNISQERSPSLSASVSLSEPKQELKERKPTNRIRDSKLKAVDTGSKLLVKSEMIERGHSQDTALTYTLYKDLPLQENSSKVITCELDQHVNVQVNSKHGNIRQSAVKIFRPANDTLSSQTSEVSEASNLSAEVFQEILKGRHADFLMRNDSQLHFSEKGSSIPETETDVMNESFSTCSENKFSRGPSSAIENITSSEKIVENSVKYYETDMINEYVSDSRILTSCKPIDKTRMIDKSVTHVMKGIMVTDQDKVNDNGSAVYSKITNASSALENCDKIQTASEKSLNSGKEYKRKGASLQGMDDIDSSISDISARIAALLMPKRMSLAQLNTNSVSSYVPSDVSDTLSSLSDMVGD